MLSSSAAERGSPLGYGLFLRLSSLQSPEDPKLHSSQSRPRSITPRVRSYRPHAELLEGRLQPSDASAMLACQTLTTVPAMVDVPVAARDVAPGQAPALAHASAAASSAEPSTPLTVGVAGDYRFPGGGGSAGSGWGEGPGN